MYRISKRFHFSASHVLEGLPAGHQCGRLHGHNYEVEVEIEGPDLDDAGMVVDYDRLGVIKDWLDDHWDHRHLNDQVAWNPTAENMARHLFDIASQLVTGAEAERTRQWSVSAVRVHETPRTCAEYRP